MRGCPAILLLAGLALPAVAQEDVLDVLGVPRTKVPSPVGWVNDFADALDPGDEQKLSVLIGELLDKAGAELCVVTMRDLKRITASSFAAKLAEEWGLGRLSSNRCALILAVMEDEEVVLYIGYKLRALIPKGKAKRIISRHIMPLFRRGRYGDALYRGAYVVAHIVASNSGVRLEAPPPPPLPETPFKAALDFFLGHLRWFVVGLAALLGLMILRSGVEAARRRKAMRTLRARRFRRGAGTFYPSRYW